MRYGGSLSVGFELTASVDNGCVDNSKQFGKRQAFPYPWFALKVRARGEGLVDDALRRKSYETFLPTYRECRQYSDRIRTVEAALFPGYLFCRFDAEHRVPVLATAGVYDLVRFGDKPAAIDENEIIALQRFAISGLAAKPWPYLRAGDKVRVEFGSMAGVDGLLIKEKGADRLILSITLLQRSVSVEIDRTWIRPA